MRAVYSDVHRQHDPAFALVRGTMRPSAEQPERADRLIAAVRRLGWPINDPEPYGLGPVLDIHTAEYVDFLQHAYEDWQLLGDGAPEIVPNVHPQRVSATYPRAIVGRAGWHMADAACPIGPHTFKAALSASDTAVTAAELVLAGEPMAYALCRPPGHHAYADMAGGFCFLNNSAIAAQRLRRRHDRVVILDIDVHHGNGTQGIFWTRPDVLTISIHADPRDFYPFFWGHAHERGEGAGEGANLNLPLPVGSGDEAWLAVLEVALRRIRNFQPGALVVALGLDASEADPFKGLAVTTTGFSRAGAAIGQLHLPTVLVQEGGYLADELTDNLESFLRGFSCGEIV